MLDVIHPCCCLECNLLNLKEKIISYREKKNNNDLLDCGSSWLEETCFALPHLY